MKKPKKEEIEDFAEVSAMNYRPVEEDRTEKVLKVVFRGAAIGTLAGLLIAQSWSDSNSLFGFYVRESGLVILGYAGAGLAVGALAGWLYAALPEKN